MAQHDYNLANAAGATFRSDANSLFTAIASSNSGATEPSTTFAYQWWMDTTANILKIRDSANAAWVNVASLSGTTWIPYRSGTLLGDIAVESAPLAIGKGGTGVTTPNDIAVTTTGGTTSRKLADRFAVVLNVLDFGAVGDGVTDDTVAIQAAIDAAEGSTFSKTVYLPANKYVVSATLTVQDDFTNIVGDGRGSTEINRTGDYGDTIIFDDEVATDKMFWNKCVGFRITTETAMTTGTHIRGIGVSNLELRDLRLEDGFKGVSLTGCANLNMRDVTIVVGDLYATPGGANQYYMQIDNDLTNFPAMNGGGIIDGCNFRSQDDTDPHVANGLIIKSADGIWINNTHIGNTDVADLRILPNTATSQVSGILMTNSWMDKTGGKGIGIAGTTSGVFGNFLFNNCVIAGGGAGSLDGIEISSADVTGIQISNCQIRNFAWNGIDLIDGRHVLIMNNYITGCNFGDLNGASGIVVTAGVDYFNINGNTIGYDADAITASDMVNGVVVAVGDSDFYTIIGNALLGNDAALTDGGTGGSTTVANNLVA